MMSKKIDKHQHENNKHMLSTLTILTNLGEKSAINWQGLSITPRHLCTIFTTHVRNCVIGATVLPAKNDSGVMICLQSNLGLRIDRSLVYYTG